MLLQQPGPRENGVYPSRLLVAALDIGKDVNVAFLRTTSGHVLLPPTKLPTLAEGFARFTAELDRHLESGAFDLVLLGHEPTGIYHEVWSTHLLDHYQRHLTDQLAPPLRYRLLHPTAVKTERLTTAHRPRKSDALDVRAMATLLEWGLGTPVVALGAPERQLRLVLGHLRRLLRQQRRVAIDLLRTFDRLWPGALGQTKAYTRSHPDLPTLTHLVGSRPLERQRVRVLLQHCPDPHAVQRLGVAGLRALFQAHDARCGHATAQPILVVVAQALLPPPAVAADLAALVQADFALYRRYESRIQAEEAQAVALLPRPQSAAGRPLLGGARRRGALPLGPPHLVLRRLRPDPRQLGQPPPHLLDLPPWLALSARHAVSDRPSGRPALSRLYPPDEHLAPAPR